MDMLRNTFRMIGATFMNSELVYSFLMGMGWFFLVGWAIALLVACASVFGKIARCNWLFWDTESGAPTWGSNPSAGPGFEGLSARDRK